MRLSDLKKKQPQQAPREEAAAPPAERRPPPAPERPAAPPPAPKPAQKPSPALGPAEPNFAGARDLYGRAVGAVRAVLGARGAQSAGAFRALIDCAAEMTATLASGDQSLLVCTASGTPDEPACAHSVNTAALSIQVAVGLGWQNEEITRMALAALLHDLAGRKAYRLGTDNLGESEAQAVRHSLRETARFLDQFSDADPDYKMIAANIIGQLHPAGTASTEPVFDKIQLSAQIITLCDIYEAMTRGRDGKPPEAATAVFRHMLAIKERFNPQLVKRIIETMSPFPPGTLLQLADGRVACVVKVNKKMLTRPVVEVWLETDGTLPERARFIDLAAEPLIAVSGSADEKKLAAGACASRVRELRVWTGA